MSEKRSDGTVVLEKRTKCRRGGVVVQCCQRKGARCRRRGGLRGGAEKRSVVQWCRRRGVVRVSSAFVGRDVVKQQSCCFVVLVEHSL